MFDLKCAVDSRRATSASASASVLAMAMALACLLLITLTMFISKTAIAAQPLSNGDFESGSLAGWSDQSTDGGIVSLAQRGACFSANDTTGLNVRGNFAALLRSNGHGNPDSQAKLSSAAFEAGDGLAFIALSESAAGVKDHSVEFSVEILDASNDAVVVSQSFYTAQTQLNQGCPSSGVNAPLRSHYISTRAYTGQSIKVRFVQNTKVKGNGFFTLIDQVAKFNQGEQPIFYGRTFAQAGIRQTHWETPYLESYGSFDDDKRVSKIKYSWYIDALDVRETKRPCVADLEDGNHIAVLYANDGQHALSDVIKFIIDEPQNFRDDFSVSEEAGTTATTGPIAQDPECESVLEDHLLGVNSPDVAVNSPDVDVNGGPFNTGDDDDEEDPDPTGDTSTATVTAQFNGAVTTPSAFSSSITASADGGDLSRAGIRWKPVSESDGNLVVLTPASFPEQSAVLIGASGTPIEIGRSVGRTNGNRVTYRFSLPGATYPANISLKIGSELYSVPNPGADIR